MADIAPLGSAPSGARFFTSTCCRSSVVEHSIGNGEVDSSILSGSTIFPIEASPPFSVPATPMDAIVINRSLPYEGLLHEIVEHNGVLYLGGIVPEDAGLDMTGQADDVLRQLKTLLDGAGSDLSCVLQVTIFMADLADKAAFNEVWKRYFTANHLPARAAVGVADLGPGVRLELTAIAARK